MPLEHLTSQTPTVQSSIVDFSIDHPSTIQPSVQPSVEESSVVHWSTIGKQSIKTALESDVGIAGVVDSYQTAFNETSFNIVVTGEYSNDDAIVLLFTFSQYIVPDSRDMRNNIANLSTLIEDFSDTMRRFILGMEAQCNTFPFTVEFRVCNADGTVLYTRICSDHG